MPLVHNTFMTCDVFLYRSLCGAWCDILTSCDLFVNVNPLKNLTSRLVVGY